jgi:hypothetical protein
MIKTETTDKSKPIVLRDGKGGKFTIDPSSVALRDRKGNKIIIPQ